MKKQRKKKEYTKYNSLCNDARWSKLLNYKWRLEFNILYHNKRWSCAYWKLEKLLKFWKLILHWFYKSSMYNPFLYTYINFHWNEKNI